VTEDVRVLLSSVIARAQAFAMPRDGHLSLHANFSWTFVGNVVYAACQWGMLTALAKLGTPEMVGQFSLGLAIGAPVMMLANLQLRGVQATDARREYDFGEYLALRLVTTALAFLVVACAALMMGYLAETMLVILALGLYKSIQSLSDVFYGLMQQQERMDYIARALILKGPLSLIALGALVYLTHSVAWGAVGLFAVHLAVLLAYERRNARLIVANTGMPAHLRPRWQPRRVATLAWLALPLGLVMMLTSLNSNFPRYVIERTLGERELGFFAAMAYLQVAGTTVVSALGQAASPRLAICYSKGDLAGFRALLLRLVATGGGLGLLTVLVALLLGRPLLRLLYTPEYAERPAVFVALMIAAGISYVSSFLGYGMTAARCFRVQLPVSGIVAATTAIGCAVLVPSRGLMGAALTLIISSVLNCGLSLIVLARALRAVPLQATDEI
jgi:O-antigen/teichoic acid export membrane protein